MILNIFFFFFFFLFTGLSESQLSADYISVNHRPRSVTDSTDCLIHTHFNTSFIALGTSHQRHFSFLTSDYMSQQQKQKNNSEMIQYVSLRTFSHYLELTFSVAGNTNIRVVVAAHCRANAAVS